MNEDFLQYIWKYQQWTTMPLFATNGMAVEVVTTGQHNIHAGPDFLNAKVRIGETLWAGNVEIHIKSSDWYHHKHQENRSYDNVILHVVYSDDKPVKDKQGELIPCLVMADRFDYQSFRYYKSWLAAAKFIPCESQAREVASVVKLSAMEDAAIERIRLKSEVYLDLLNSCKGDIEETFYRGLCRSFGLKVNAEPFEYLGRALPFKIVRSNWQSMSKLEALFLGQAGFLTDVDSSEYYVKILVENYSFLKSKYKLEPMAQTNWKFFRLRPPNFPTVRLIQLAILYHTQNALAQKIIEAEDDKELRALFEVEINDGFWLTHYTLETESKPKPKSIGLNRLDIIIINAVVPFLFALAQYSKDETYKARAMKFLESMKPEQNTKVKKFIELGFPIESALDSQGIIGLFNNQCLHQKCLNCKIGIQLLKTNV